MAKILVTEGCWVWLGASSCGGKSKGDYGIACYQGRRRKAHRVIWELKRGAIPEGMHVLHRCDQPLCVNPDHLFLGNHIDNMRDMVAKGRLDTKGVRNGRAKLSESDVIAIRMHDIPRYRLGLLYGVSDAMICDIKNGQSWTHLT